MMLHGGRASFASEAVVKLELRLIVLYNSIKVRFSCMLSGDVLIRPV